MHDTKELTADLVRHKKEKYGDLWLVLSLDSLSTHVADEAKIEFFLLKQLNLNS